VMMGLSEEDGRSDEEGRSSSCSYADLIKNGAIAVSLSLVLYLGGGTDLAMAKRLEVANNPELLPKEYTTVIDVAGFLSQGQVCPLLALASSKWVLGFPTQLGAPTTTL
jgi:hypothetical protein